MGALMRAIDWVKTPVGAPETWPQSLRTAVSILLESRFPMYIAWGPQLVQFYNDGYRPVLGSTKHPAAMGHSAQATFAESWHIIGPQFDGVWRGTAVGSEDWMLPLDRHGYLEECYFTYSYSPIRDESGGVGGILATLTETTGRVLGERRLRTLRDLAARAGTVKHEGDVWREAARALAGNAFDVPFALLYRLGSTGEQSDLMEVTGWDTQAQAASRFGDLPASSRWSFPEALAAPGGLLISDVRAHFGDLPGGPWPEAPHSVMVLPITRPGAERPHGFLVAGLSARRALDDDYRGFLGLVADHIATAVSNARAYEDEKRRAEALAEIDRSKTAFFSNVSHEFRTPLTLMLGPVEDSLADVLEPLPPAQRERQELVRRNGLRLQKLVNTLLDFARLEAGRAQASFIPTDLSALTRDLVSSFDSAMTTAGLELVVTCPPLPDSVYVDPEMWEKVVLNLLSNAFKFTFEGQVRIALKWRDDTVELTVQDTGIGMPAEELPRIFERFHRVEGSRGRSHEGTGIGLALVRELVKLHGGAVTVTSALDQGTTFTVSLPTGSAHLPREHVGAARALTSTGIGASAFLAELSQWSTPEAPLVEPALSSSEARILLADDNADMRGYLLRLLSPHWRVESVSDGTQALIAARRTPPDLIISDVMMPGIGGLELVQALRADEHTRTIPILLLSARAGEEATIEGLRSGADEYLVKPFSANELRARVNALLTVSRLRQASVHAERAHAEEAQRLLDEARRATRSREETLAVVSHDLRSPLTAISTSAELLRRIPLESGPGERVRKQAESIRRSASRMNRLIDDLLDLESIETGTLSIEARPQTVEELIRDAREQFGPQAAEKGLRLDIDVEPGLVVKCDRERILQAIGNLLSNAIKFSPSGTGGAIHLRAGLDAGTRDIRFSVTDSGPGVPLEAQQHIFDRYWHAAQKRRGGHGLGLSIAKGIVESHGGRMRLERTSDAGSTFCFWLPAEQGVAEPATTPRPPPQWLGSEEHFVQGGGDMGALMRAFDWRTTALGPLERWPQSLRTSVSTMLRSPYPIILFWGPELNMLYNDPFRPILGAKHPLTLGARGAEALAEEWRLLGPLMQRVHETGEPLFIENGNVNFARRPGGLREEAYFTWSYNPTIGETGEIAGLFAIASETTRQVVGDRRLAILRELSIRAALSEKVDALFVALEEVLTPAGHDLPFALLYVVRNDKAQLVSCANLPRGAAAAPTELLLDEETSWPLSKVVRTGQEALVEDLSSRFGPLPGGPWPEPTTRALLLPVPMGADAELTGVLVAGISPLRALDDEYQSFLQLLARQLAASLASARAYEQERQRAEQLALLDQAKTAFFSNVSHEFRTPLTLILGPIEDAMARTPRALGEEQLDLVRRNALRLYKMVNTLLDFSRMEAGRTQATYVPTDLSAFTRNLASAFESAVGSAGLRLRVDCPPLPESIYVDPEMWEKVVLNLLSNAVKYTHQGEIRVGMHWRDGRAVLTVQDTGVGIPEEDLPRIFERFYRVRATQGRSHEGTGIGLAMVEDLVKLHGGDVSVTSRLGVGTTFTVRLPGGSAHLPPERIDHKPRSRSSAAWAAPFVDEAQRWSASDAPLLQPQAPDATRTADDAQLDVPLALASSRILLVDDNADLRSYVSGLLGRRFPHVETATNGEEALARARVQPPDLILSDVMMPVLDGFGLVRELRADPRTRAIPIILLSARAGDESTVEGLSSGADDYLVKPFSARELIARVRTQLEMVSVRREVTRKELEKEELLESVHLRDEFLSLVSHELRTPVSVLALNIQSLLRSLDRQGGQRSPEELLRARALTTEKQLQRLTRLVEHLLDVSEFVTGRLELVRQDVDLTATVKAVVDEAREKAARAESTVTLNAPSSIVGRFDPERLHQLVEGLLDNALKFGAGKPVEVTVAPTEDGVRISVVDHGPGVAPEDHERIFGRFERAVSARNHGGFGLGLWMARHIVEGHEGRIHVTRTEGGGATFTVVLPVMEAPG
ncbi:response regulator [Myxococcus sp. CA033]|uniref:ATP-binding protein n=1 Tax=Myxococcus sp. CA033 TaxID=2741516 RepID=UPI00157B0A80|nr:ATP-binding protein [Myxococcus sp. CA033]NTX36572.1 response regulator [Myxococcus sp. CA033]